MKPKLPFRAGWLWYFIPQPRWLRRWYFRISHRIWGHPSNGHWKKPLMFYKGFYGRPLNPGERDIWGGCYCAAGTKDEVQQKDYTCPS